MTQVNNLNVTNRLVYFEKTLKFIDELFASGIQGSWFLNSPDTAPLRWHQSHNFNLKPLQIKASKLLVKIHLSSESSRSSWGSSQQQRLTRSMQQKVIFFSYLTNTETKTDTWYFHLRSSVDFSTQIKSG